MRLLIDAYRQRGHETAEYDPLLPASQRKFGQFKAKKLDISDYGFVKSDLDKIINIYTFDSSKVIEMKLFEFISMLERQYCQKIGYQYMHIDNSEIRFWIRQRINQIDINMLDNGHLKKTADRLCRDYIFVNFLTKTFPTAKRFGSEGADSAISGVGALVDHAAINGIEDIVIGMPHRGRLNILYSILRKPASDILAEFQDVGINTEEKLWGNSGDVKYHLGYQRQCEIEGNKLNLEILPNPSHLETVDPLVYGKVRAIQNEKKDVNHEKALGILMHGDAAFSAQGVVYESIQMTNLKEFTSGGIIHIVVNNQVGFTTDPIKSRTSMYCCDLAEVVQAPVFHVNAEYPELVDEALRFAFDFRKKFQQDVIIDVIGYRKFGHNELDQPQFTQPNMYERIKKKKAIYELYMERMFEAGVITKEVAAQREGYYKSNIQESYERTKQANFIRNPSPDQLKYNEVKLPFNGTQISCDEIDFFNETLNVLPKDFNINKQLQKIYKLRYDSVKNDTGMDYATAEAFAFASILQKGFGVNLTGQDVERGTFSHRHATLIDQITEQKYCPLEKILTQEQKEKNKLIIANSHLSEYGVLGYIYGYNFANINNICIWEAQFGDFANGCQIIIDNYITSAASKWQLRSNVVINLPHGMEGQGAEHSSGRLERFLQMSDDFDGNTYGNLYVVQASTSANYFHALCRQMDTSQNCKPLVNFNSKKLLRFKDACSKREEFKGKFQKIIPDQQKNLVPDDQIKQLILVSGAFYYDLLADVQSKKIDNIAIVRVEQIAPFCYRKIERQLRKYKNASVSIAQPEHSNQGIWLFCRPRVIGLLKMLKKEGIVKSTNVNYIGRRSSSATATGSSKIHKEEHEIILRNI